MERWKGGYKVDTNVGDHVGCSMLGFMTVGVGTHDMLVY